MVRSRGIGPWLGVSLLMLTALAGCSTPPPSPPPTTATELPDIRNLRGRSEAELRDLLGEPDLRRSEPPALVWQYRTADCVLDVFLYREGPTYRVAYAETRVRFGLSLISQPDCFAALLSGHERFRQSRL